MKNETPYKLNFTITPHIDFTNQTLAFETKTWGNQIQREMVCFKEKVVRDYLIALGWTPPPDSLCRVDA